MDASPSDLEAVRCDHPALMSRAWRVETRTPKTSQCCLSIHAADTLISKARQCHASSMVASSHFLRTRSYSRLTLSFIAPAAATHGRVPTATACDGSAATAGATTTHGSVPAPAYTTATGERRQLTPSCHFRHMPARDRPG